MNQLSDILNLKSVPCPLNAVKLKLALEKLKPHEKLIVLLDKGESEEMVKKTITDMNYRFYAIEDDEKILKLKVLYES